MPFRRGANQHNLTGFGRDNQMSVGQNHLPVAVTARLPFSLTGGNVKADQNRLVQTIDVTFKENRTGEFILHPVVFPYLPHRIPAFLLPDFHQRRPVTVPGGDKDAVFIEKDGLRGIYVIGGFPLVIPQQASVIDGQPHDAAGADHQNLPPPREGYQHGRRVGRLVAQRFPDRLPGQLVIGHDGFSRTPSRQDNHLVIHNQGGSRHSPV